MDREQRTDAPRTAPVRCSRPMKTNTSNTSALAAWLEAVERFAQRVDDAPLALAALRAHYNADSTGCFAALLSELARYAGDRADVVVENGHRTARCQREWAVDAVALLSRGWALLEAVESETSR
jgi:hypothetical protein